MSHSSDHNGASHGVKRLHDRVRPVDHSDGYPVCYGYEWLRIACGYSGNYHGHRCCADSGTLVYFLHMNSKSDEGWNLTAFIFTVIIIAIVVVGSIWIMWNLNYNMMMH